MLKPSRGQIWFVNLDPIVGHEQAKKRPCLILSSDLFNHGPAELFIVIPLTSKKRNIPFHVAVYPPAGGLLVTSFIMCEQVRSVSLHRLSNYLGDVGDNTMHAVEYTLKMLLEFS